jgi:glycerol-3-phosphate acyltransferase PlsX
MRIAVDAMGGDFAPVETVKGAVEAAEKNPAVSKILLIGVSDIIKKELSKLSHIPNKIEIVHASECIGMEEQPVMAVKRKTDSSINRGVEMVKANEADAFVSMGNTGAVMVASALKLGALEGVKRPALAVVMPALNRPFILIDAGANTDCTPEMLVQFAAMGSVYSSTVIKREKPVVGLLNVGGEAGKGNEVTKEAYNILSNTHFNFRGNVEGHDIFKGETDVIVCDGFVGNVVLKTSESAAHAIVTWMRQEFKKNPIRIAGALILKGAFNALKKRTDPSIYGGALLLGVKGICIIGHGASRSKAVFHAISLASKSAHSGLNERIIQEISQLKVTK